MKILEIFQKKLINKFKKKEYEMPYIRAVVVLSENAIDEGIEDDMNKIILVYYGDEITEKLPYSKATIKVLQELRHIPIYDSTKKDKFIEGEEIVPNEVFYEEI